jgi:predicted anti-sigma-YlaC factor YlaD
MTVDPRNMSCQEFQAQLADLVGSGEDVSLHPHLQNCETCRALLADLETIAEAARQLLPIEQPNEDLWDRIELAIKREEGTTQPD